MMLKSLFGLLVEGLVYLFTLAVGFIIFVGVMGIALKLAMNLRNIFNV